VRTTACRLIVSTWKKSAARIPSAWAVRNSASSGRCGADPGRRQPRARSPRPWTARSDAPAGSTHPGFYGGPNVVLPCPMQHQLLQRGRRRCTPGVSTSSGVVPLPGDQAAVPAQQRPWGDQKDAAPAAAQEQRRQRGLPEPDCGLIADLTVDLSPQHRVLMSENEQLGVLAGVPAQQYRWHGQQRTSCSVQQRNDHLGSISAAAEELRPWIPTSGDDFPSPTVWSHADGS